MGKTVAFPTKTKDQIIEEICAEYNIKIVLVVPEDYFQYSQVSQTLYVPQNKSKEKNIETLHEVKKKVWKKKE